MKTWKPAIVCTLTSGAIIIGVYIFFPWGQLYFSELKSGWSQRTIHDSIYKKSLRPATAWVQAFHKTHGRLPTADELNQETAFKFPNCTDIIIYVAPTPGETWGTLGSDFILLIHHADWNLFLRSWDGKETKYWTD